MRVVVIGGGPGGLFLNVGDTIYADQPLQETVKLDDGSLWRNVMTPAKAKVAENITATTKGRGSTPSECASWIAIGV